MPLVSFRRSFNRVNGFLNEKCQQGIEWLYRGPRPYSLFADDEIWINRSFVF